MEGRPGCRSTHVVEQIRYRFLAVNGQKKKKEEKGEPLEGAVGELTGWMDGTAVMIQSLIPRLFCSLLPPNQSHPNFSDTRPITLRTPHITLNTWLEK